MTPVRPAERSPSSEWRIALALLLGLALVQLVVGSRIPLDPDEAYYWEWSRHLAPGYYDHPPAIAFMIRAGTALFGPTPLGVRFVPVLANLGGALLLLLLARRLGSARAARVAALLVIALPILSAWLVLATPDSPLFLTDALALYASVRALEAPPRSRSALGWWLASGAALALGLASKLLAILLPFGLVLALLSRRELRGRLAEPGLYAGALLAALMVGPVSAVSASIATRFQLHHGLGRSNGSALWQGLDFVTGQAGMAGGILFVLLAIAVVRSLGRSADAPRYALAVVALSTFAVFAISSLRHRVEANWPLPAYLPALVLLATMDAGERWRRWVRAGIGVGGGIVAVGYLQMLTPVLPFGEELVRRGHGWDEVAERVTERRASHTWVAGNTYQDAAELAFQLADHPRVFALNLRSRDNQYSAWPGFPDLARVGDDLIFVLADRHDLPPAVADLQRHFVRVRLVDSIGPTPHLLEVPARRIWLMEDWRGSWPERD